MMCPIIPSLDDVSMALCFGAVDCTSVLGLGFCTDAGGMAESDDGFTNVTLACWFIGGRLVGLASECCPCCLE